MYKLTNSHRFSHRGYYESSVGAVFKPSLDALKIKEFNYALPSGRLSPLLL